MKYYIGNIEADPEFLEHHGILGMKWGQRNGPPYPLDASDHSAAEKKAGWRKSLDRSSEYSKEQKIRDRKLYGAKATKRIERRMKKGEGVQSARHNEVVRKNTKNKIKNVSANVLKGALTIGGAAYVARLIQKKGYLSSVDQFSLNEATFNIGRSIVNALFK